MMNESPQADEERIEHVLGRRGLSIRRHRQIITGALRGQKAASEG